MVLRTVLDLRQFARTQHTAGKTIGLVPTMGALHEGHASLIRAARQRCDVVVVTIFVNPTQFGPQEDFARYPRTFEADCALARREGADAVFAPTVEEMYPAGATTFVEAEGLSGRLDGASRPGHFRGVATVVTKLLIAAEADRAYFGQKDAAQVAVLRRMATDLRIGTEIVVCPIVREADGLALSSRNQYLSPAERAEAVQIYQTLQQMRDLIAKGHARRVVEQAAASKLERAGFVLDYAAIRRAEDLSEPADNEQEGLVALIAARLGSTRLIDNLLFD